MLGCFFFAFFGVTSVTVRSTSSSSSILRIISLLQQITICKNWNTTFFQYRYFVFLSISKSFRGRFLGRVKHTFYLENRLYNFDFYIVWIVRSISSISRIESRIISITLIFISCRTIEAYLQSSIFNNFDFWIVKHLENRIKSRIISNRAKRSEITRYKAF